MTICGSDDDTTTTTTEDTRVTYCDLDRTNNVWVEGADENGEGGVCLLDTMSAAQVIYVLQRDETARADLVRVTSDPDLKELAATVPRLSTGRPGDKLQREVNQKAGPVAFYSVFRGRPPTAR